MNHGKAQKPFVLKYPMVLSQWSFMVENSGDVLLSNSEPRWRTVDGSSLAASAGRVWWHESSVCLRWKYELTDFSPCLREFPPWMNKVYLRGIDPFAKTFFLNKINQLFIEQKYLCSILIHKNKYTHPPSRVCLTALNISRGTADDPTLHASPCVRLLFLMSSMKRNKCGKNGLK